MKRIVLGLLIGSLVLGAITLPAQAHRWHYHHHDHGLPLGAFLAGMVADIFLNALRPPPVAREPRYYYKGMICQDVRGPGRWEVRRWQEDGFHTYHLERFPGFWRRECYRQ